MDNEQIIKENYGFIHSISVKFQGDKHQRISDGFLGALKALKYYNNNKNKFTTFAHDWIKWMIMDTIRKEQDRTIKTFSIEEIKEHQEARKEKEKKRNFENKEFIETLLKYLSKRDKKLVSLYFGIGTYPHSYAKIGTETGRTKEAVRQRLRKALKRLRYYAERLK